MEILSVKPLWPEKKNFCLHRDDIGDMYIFIHFLTPVTARIKNRYVNIAPGGCIFFGVHSVQHFTSELCSLLHDWFHADRSCGELMSRYGLECERVYYPADGDEITRIITEIEMEYLHREKNYREMSDALTERLFIILSRSGVVPAEVRAPDRMQKEQFTKARTQIHMNIAHQWSVEEMAELVNLSPSYFYSVYKKIFGISPQQDLTNKRIQTAQALLMQSGMTVEAAAELVGYNSQYSFIRRFRSVTGITPGAYKNSASGGKQSDDASRKWYGVIMDIPAQKLGMERDGKVDDEQVCRLLDISRRLTVKGASHNIVKYK